MGSLRRLAGTPLLLRRNLSMPVDHALLRQRPGDQFVVAFPRSGSTWVRTMLATLRDPEKGFDPYVFNETIPGVSFANLPRLRALPSPRLMFSHTAFRRSLPRVVYVVRDGRDALISYYHFSTTREGKAVPFSEWFDLYAMGGFGPRWDRHVKSWLIRGQQHLGDKLLVVRFEDLKKNPVPGLQAIASFLGLPADLQIVSRAVEMAKTEKAREREEKQWGHIQDPNASFYRGGKTGQWEEFLTGEIYAKFMKLSAEALRLAGYSL